MKSSSLTAINLLVGTVLFFQMSQAAVSDGDHDADELGLCQLLLVTKGLPAYVVESEAFSRRHKCSVENANQLGFRTEQFDYQGRPKSFIVRFVPAAPLKNPQDCQQGQQPVRLNGTPTLFDSHLQIDANDLQVTELDHARLNTLPASQRSAELEAIRLAGLVPYEALAIKGYMGSAYMDMNRALRGETSASPNLVSRIRLAVSGLEKLARVPQYHVTGIVRRALNIEPEAFAQLYPPGECVTEKGFASAAEEIPPDGPTRFGSKILVILSKTAARVSSFAYGRFAEEREVIFRPGTVFRVYGHVENFQTPTSPKIILEECPCDADSSPIN